MIDATPLLRAYARRRNAVLARQDPGRVQRETLRRLVARAAGTRFGAEHDFAGIADPGGFRERVPLRRYEDFWTRYWGPAFPVLDDVTWPGRIPFFAASSGTSSGNTKFIPVTPEMIAANRHAGLDLLVHHVTNRPRSRVFGGRNFMLGGSTALVERAPGVRTGDLSGIAAATLPFWARPFAFPPPEIALIADWEEKIAVLSRLAPKADIRSLGGTPSWVLLFLDRLAAEDPQRRGRIVDFFPRLELLIHGGVNFAPYRPRFEGLLAGSRAELREVYPASEGFIAAADRGPGEGLRMMLDHGIFYEFVPVGEIDRARPTRHWIGDAELGVDYALAVTSCAGLWAYLLGDVVRLIGREPPRLLVTGRLSYTLSAFGEHLTGEEIEDSVAEAAAAIGVGLRDYAVGALFPEAPGALGGHLFVIELENPACPGDLRRFAEALDLALSRRNLDYRDHRAGGFGLRAPEIVALPRGAFAEWMRRRGRLGGQNKVRRVISDPELFRDLRAFAASLSG